ncbi:hypothetical protein PAXINDRAFT_183005 [Paxillus involutus ATCC 200175]|uniref:Uncharacterized protein n=1 Tax=Paxillus involutus ATCC 200175 TaxID=664439 RepID=A0A0C9ST03_PAXIN|nr:hypothetical protein PAXINDRAFT_183005 [Paxillus involutus ATCC 200175]
MDAEEQTLMRTEEVEEKMLALTCAAVSVELDNDGKIFELPELTEEDMVAGIRSDRAAISEVLAFTKPTSNASLPSIQTSTTPSRPSDLPPTYHQNLDFHMLVHLRRIHQTQRAAKSVRVHSTVSEGAGHHENSRKHSEEHGGNVTVPVRLQVVRQMQDVLRAFESEAQVRGVGTGLERHVRWTGTLGSAETTTGNTANAALAAGQRATAVIRRRQKFFAKYRVPQWQQLGDGLINVPNSAQPHHNLLTPNSWGFVLVDKAMFIGKVLAIYSRGGGKNAAHSWQPEVKSIWGGLVHHHATLRTFVSSSIPCHPASQC